METVATCSMTDGSAFTSVYVYAITTVDPQLTATAVATHPRCRISKRWHFADIKNFTEDDHETLTVDRNSAIYFVYVYEIATNTPGGGSVADGGFRRSLKRHVADVKNIARKDQNRSKFRKYENVCLWNQAKRLEKLLFAATNAAAIDSIEHCFFLLSLATAFVLPTKNNFSTTFNPPKNRDIHIVVFL